MTATVQRDRWAFGSALLTMALIVASLTFTLAGNALAQSRDEIATQFATRRATLKDDDLEGRYNLSYWLYQNKAYDLAGKELTDLSKRVNEGTPEDLRNRIALLTRIVNDRQKIDGTTPAPTSSTPTTPTAATRPAAATPVRPTTQPATKADPSRPQGPGSTTSVDLPPLAGRLTDDQINMIRLYEIDLDKKPIVVVPREVIDAVFSKYADRSDVPKGIDEQRAFRNREGWAQLDLLFKLQARELYPKVKIRDDPPSLRAFRADLPNRYAISYCGAVTCHGGPNAGSMFLYRAEGNSDRSVYTNFYILQALSTNDGKVIDRDVPGKSLLIQYGLPRASASTPHPDVPNWRPNFASESDPQIASLVTWIDSLYKPQPNYGINYTFPVTAKRAAALAGSATTQPAEAPAPAKPR